jgi:hypothetical protein
MQRLEVINNTNAGFGIAVFALGFSFATVRISDLMNPTLADATIQGTKLTLTIRVAGPPVYCRTRNESLFWY